MKPKKRVKVAINKIIRYIKDYTILPVRIPVQISKEIRVKFPPSLLL